MTIRFRDGTFAKQSDLDAIAKAFGFQSMTHLDDVLAGRAPSAMKDKQSRTAARQARSTASRRRAA